ncbi:MAG: serine/threonine protein kinase [Actinobacteria bacterium]|nr:serine/threonine protein kinase [Actinomycetota bacterium]
MWEVQGYAVDEQIGRGGTSEVWRGRVLATGESVAFKRIHFASEADRHYAFGEAALLRVLDDPHLVRLRDVIIEGSDVVLVLDYAAGGSLHDLLRRRGRLTAGETVGALAPIGATLSYLHTEHVVHGDVSAANILFSADRRPLLADLGVARIAGDRRPAASTPAYIDPVVAAGRAPTTASDVFSLAAVALHALTGIPVWQGYLATEMTGRARRGDVGDLPERLAALPAGLGPTLWAGLELDPQRRCSMTDLTFALRQAQAPEPVHLGAGGPRPMLERPPAPVGPGRHRRTGGGTSAGAVSAARAVPNQGSWAARLGAVVSPARPAPAARPDFARPSSPSTGRASPDRSSDAAVKRGRRARPPDTDLHSSRMVMGWTTGDPIPTRAVDPATGNVRPLRPSQTSRDPRRLSGRTLVVLAALVLAMAGVLAAIRLAHGSAAAAHSSPLAHRSPLAHTSPLAGSSSGVVSSPVDGSSPVEIASRELRRLDDLRNRAFATRDPELLRQVYALDPLFEQDRASLTAAVPSGCALTGLRTEYSDLRASTDAGGSITVTTNATLAGPSLVCGSQREPASPGNSARLRIVLTPEARGQYRISGQQVMS